MLHTAAHCCCCWARNPFFCNARPPGPLPSPAAGDALQLPAAAGQLHGPDARLVQQLHAAVAVRVLGLSTKEGFGEVIRSKRGSLIRDLVCIQGAR